MQHVDLLLGASQAEEMRRLVGVRNGRDFVSRCPERVRELDVRVGEEVEVSGQARVVERRSDRMPSSGARR